MKQEKFVPSLILMIQLSMLGSKESIQYQCFGLLPLLSLLSI